MLLTKRLVVKVFEQEVDEEGMVHIEREYFETFEGANEVSRSTDEEIIKAVVGVIDLWRSLQ